MFHPLQTSASRVNNFRRYDALHMTETIPRPEQPDPILVSIGIIAWNEADGITRTLESLFRQSLFERLARRNLRCQVLCLANGCTDETPRVAAQVFEAQRLRHPARHALLCRAFDIRERGKLNAWNLFVHHLSAPSARYFILMDADILIDQPHTLANLVDTLEQHTDAAIATDEPRKHLAAKSRKSLADHLSLLASRMTQTAEAQLCGQLYCIRADVARRIYLPRDLSACEDGFIKSIVCTDFLTNPSAPQRIRLAPEASHSFEAYTSLRDILRNQKRQMIGQAIVHVLVDRYLRTLSAPERLNLAATLRKKDQDDPLWLQRLIAEHLSRTRFFWRLIPGIVAFRFRRLARLRGMERLACLPSAVAGFLISLVACFRARAFLRAGSTRYWPHAKSCLKPKTSSA